jgi:hypothetical protein
MALSAKDWATECARQELQIISQQERIRELEEVLALSEKRRAVIEAEWGYVIAEKDKAEARVIELETALTEAIDWIGASPEGGFDDVVQRLSRIATSQFDRGDKP